MTGAAQSERLTPVRSEPSRGVTRAASFLSWVLALTGVALLCALVLLGFEAPPLPPTLLLALALALCIWKVALYPSEFAASAELGVLLCAVTAFRDDAAIVGPLLLAVLVGPLDMIHWRQRAFVRMAYNSGNRSLSVLGAASVFAATVALFGSSPKSLFLATALAALAAAIGDTIATVLLSVTLGATPKSARDELRDIDALAFPLALVGGAIGFLASEFGWWAALLPLVALAFAPEALQARASHPFRTARGALLLAELFFVLAVLAQFQAVPTWPILVLTTLLSVIAGRELYVDAGAPLVPTLGIVVVAAAITVDPKSAVFVGAAVGGCSTLVSWGACPVGGRFVASLGVTVASVTAAVVAAVATSAVAEEAWIAASGVVGVALFALVASLTARQSDLRRPWSCVTSSSSWCWSLPLVMLGVVSPVAGGAGPLAALIAALVVVAVLGAWCGSTPWQSLFLSRVLGRVRLHARRAAFAAACLGSVVTAGCSVGLETSAETQRWLLWSTVASGIAATTMALWSTRQWRMAPAVRRRELLALFVSSALWFPTATLASVEAGDITLFLSAVIALLAYCAGRGGVRVADRRE